MTISDYVLKGDYNAVKELLSNEVRHMYHITNGNGYK